MFTSLRKETRFWCNLFHWWVRVVAWLNTVYVALMLVTGIWLLTLGADQYFICLAEIGNEWAGFGSFQSGPVFLQKLLEVEFQRGALTSEAVDSARAIYLTAYLEQLLERGVILAVLWCVAGIFRSMDRESTPFVKRVCRTLFFSGILLWAGRFVLEIVDMIAAETLRGYHGGNLDSMGTLLLPGFVLLSLYIALSGVFEYGMILQRESDETL